MWSMENKPGRSSLKSFDDKVTYRYKFYLKSEYKHISYVYMFLGQFCFL
jgi:hypothetical protein